MQQLTFLKENSIARGLSIQNANQQLTTAFKFILHD